ncbi:MAG TPA: TIGR03557 family F420-dependent LLM class oxidoreductase [Solirubrobacterales bacterium]|nr:TIGR03557 family F420-dependent LLM class oxidoreductase [Solirubrobacterales bacterium]
MGVIEAARGVLWARKHSPDQPAYVASLAHERFRPHELLDQAVAAEEAGFDAIACSDHLAPWWPAGDPAPNSSGNAWVWLGAVGQATREASIGTAVTGAVYRYNPVVLAQQVATLEALNPGRAFLGVGSSEAMNEIPAGFDWPSVEEQQERMTEQLQIINALLAGETVDFQGKYFKTRGARLYTLPERRVPVYVSAFGENAARIAARHGDGLWTLADPMQAPGVIGAYREERESLGKEPGEIILQALFSWAEDDDTAFESAKEWKGTIPPEHYTDPIYEPAEIKAGGDEVSDTKFKAGAIIGSDPAAHVRKIKAIGQLGATAIVLMNVSAADPVGALRVYGNDVLPELRG